MIRANSSRWLQYSQHVLKWEGKTSSDPRDTAASCYPGGIHTNKGVTFCTFKSMAPRLGIQPVTHARFLKLTDAEIALFQYEFYKAINGDKLPNALALAMTEAAWGSGTNRAFIHLRDSLKALGVPVSTNSQAIQSTRMLDQVKLYKAYQDARIAFLERLGAMPKYAMYIKGWRNRFKDFNTKFTPFSSLPFFFSACFAMGNIFLS